MNLVQEFYSNTRKDLSRRAFISWFDDWVDSVEQSEMPAYLIDTVLGLSEDIFDMWDEYNVGSDFSTGIITIEEFLVRSYGKQLNKVEDITSAENFISDPRRLV